jgi:magnesium transporter
MENMNFVDQQKQSLIQALADAGETEALLAILQKMPAVEVAEVLAELSLEEIQQYLNRFDAEIQGVIFSDFREELQLELFQTMDKRHFARIFSHMYSDVRADLYQKLSKEDRLQLLPYLSKKVREDVIALSGYSPETAGGIMNTDFATVTTDMTVQEAMAKIRRDAPSRKMVYYIYVVDEMMRLIGFITLKDLILAEPEDKLETLVRTEYIYAEVDEDRESVARKVERYDLVAIPVINPLGQLVGIVRHDDAMEVMREEHTEDMERFMGIVTQVDTAGEYLETSTFNHFRRRIVWVAGLAAVGIISGIIIHRYEGALEQMIILALYMPMMADTGGNSGSQAATVVIRALALGQVTLRNWFRIIWKEARIAMLLAVCLGLLAYGKVLFLSWEAEVPEAYSLQLVAFAISLALSLQVISSTVIGAGLPLLVKRFGGDPAVAASPAITTVVDITGLLIYFSIATAFFDL